LKILLITEFFPNQRKPIFLGGVQARTYHIARRLRNLNKIEIISLQEGGIEATLKSLPSRLAFSLSTIFASPKDKPDIIEASNVSTYIPAFLLAKRLRVPAVAWIPDLIENGWWKSFTFPVAFSGYLSEKISISLKWDRIIAMSKTTKKKLVRAGVKEEKIRVVYGGVEYDKLRNMKVKKFQKPTICCIARLVSYKRISDLITAVSYIREKISDIQCNVIGEGPERGKLENQIQEMGLNKSLKLLGSFPHDKAMEYLKKSQIFCLPSVVEGFGIVTIESLAAGVPYVNADIPPTKEITNTGKGGFLFQKENPRDLSDKAIALLTNKKLYLEKQKETENLAKKYDWSIIAEQTKNCYREVV
jgi:glycosyltransferase involved in cell wall biosynthesis